jgi:hypothetical protein
VRPKERFFKNDERSALVLAHPLRVGLYGVSGIGKSYLLGHLNQYVNSVHTLEGSSAIDSVCIGGLSAFKSMSSEEKYLVRCKSVDELNRQFMTDKRHMVVAGHYSFLTQNGYEIAWTDADANFYDVIIMLDCTSETHYQRSTFDTARKRSFSQSQLDGWRDFEQSELQARCEESNIPFYILNSELPLEQLLMRITELVSTEVINSVADKLAIQFDSIILCDCDGTLNKDDILDYAADSELSPLKISTIFKKYGGYSRESFFAVSQYIDAQVPKLAVDNMLLNAGVLQPHALVASELASLREINRVRQIKDALVLISCGFPNAWNALSLAADMVMGGASFNRFGCILTDALKAQFAERLKKKEILVTSFGNSSSDFGMLLNSDFAVFVYDQEIKPHYAVSLQNLKSIKLLCLGGTFIDTCSSR